MDDEQRLYAREWIKLMWSNGVIDQRQFKDLSDAVASLDNYIDGKPHDSHQYAELEA